MLSSLRRLGLALCLLPLSLPLAAMDANGLGYVGGEDYGFICLAKRGSVSAEQRAAVESWLKGRSELKGFTLSPLLDVWYPENTVNA